MLKRLKHRMVSGISSSQWLISTSAQLPIVEKCTRRLWSLKKCTRRKTALVPWQGGRQSHEHPRGVARCSCLLLFTGQA